MLRSTIGWVLVAILVSGLATMGCEPAAPNSGQKAGEEGKKTEAGAEKSGPVEPEEELLEAMKSVADILNANQADANAALQGLRVYAETNEERLKGVVERLRTKADAMTPEAQDAFWQQNTSREEYLLWDGAMRRFEDTFPEQYAELEELTNTIQSAGTEDLIEDQGSEIDVVAAQTEADAAFTALLGFSFEGATKDDIKGKIEALAEQAKAAEGQFQTVFQQTDDDAASVAAMFKAADCHAVAAKKLRALESVEGLDDAYLETLKGEAASVWEARAKELHASAMTKASEKGIEAPEAAGDAPADGAAEEVPAGDETAGAEGAPAQPVTE